MTRVSAVTERDDTLSALEALRTSGIYGRVKETVDRKAADPNIFRVVPSLTRAEGAHSAFVAWLLNPKQWHGLGDRFAREMLGACIKSIRGVKPFPWPARSLEIVSVDREFDTGMGRIDVLLRARIDGRVVVLGLENKIESPEGPGQLKRYGDALADRMRPGATVVVTLLAPEEVAPRPEPRVSWSSLGYATLIEALQTALATAHADPAGSQGTASFGRAVVDQYLSILRSDVMKIDEELDGLCRELYREHRGAWRAIRARLPSESDDLHAALAQEGCKVLRKRPGGDWQFSIRRNRYAMVYRPEWLKYFRSSGKLKNEFVEVEGAMLSSPAVAIVIAAKELEGEDATPAPARVRVEVRLRIWNGPSTGDSTAKLLRALGAKGRRQITRRLKSGLADSRTSPVETTGRLLSDKRVLRTVMLVRL